MLSTLDLSSVTDRIVEYLTTAVASWPAWVDNGGSIPRFNIVVSGRMPETVRAEAQGCHLTMYLIHLAADPATRNSPLTTKAAQPNRSHALGLTLYYLLTAWARASTTQEQQAMSIAVKALHERGTYVDPADGFSSTITLEAEKPDEANRRWQSFTTAFRLSAVYRVGVVFVSPTVIPGVPAAPPQRIGLALGPMALPYAGAGALTSTASRIDFTLPAAPGEAVVYDYSPAVVPPGGSLAVFGTGLDQATASRLYLVDAAGTEAEVTAWKAPAALNTPSRIVVRLPNTVGGLPDSPAAGIYQLRAGSSVAAGDTADYRSNSAALMITPLVTPPPSPWTPAAGVFSFAAAGLVPGSTELLLDTVTLRPVGAAPAAGEFEVAGAAVSFRPPADLPSGRYFVRLRVRAVEGPPVGFIDLP